MRDSWDAGDVLRERSVNVPPTPSHASSVKPLNDQPRSSLTQIPEPSADSCPLPAVSVPQLIHDELDLIKYTFPQLHSYIIDLYNGSASPLPIASDARLNKLARQHDALAAQNARLEKDLAFEARKSERTAEELAREKKRYAVLHKSVQEVKKISYESIQQLEAIRMEYDTDIAERVEQQAEASQKLSDMTAQRDQAWQDLEVARDERDAALKGQQQLDSKSEQTLQSRCETLEATNATLHSANEALKSDLDLARKNSADTASEDRRLGSSNSKALRDQIAQREEVLQARREGLIRAERVMRKAQHLADLLEDSKTKQKECLQALEDSQTERKECSQALGYEQSKRKECVQAREKTAAERERALQKFKEHAGAADRRAYLLVNELIAAKQALTLSSETEKKTATERDAFKRELELLKTGQPSAGALRRQPSPPLLQSAPPSKENSESVSTPQPTRFSKQVSSSQPEIVSQLPGQAASEALPAHVASKQQPPTSKPSNAFSKPTPTVNSAVPQQPVPIQPPARAQKSAPSSRPIQPQQGASLPVLAQAPTPSHTPRPVQQHRPLETPRSSQAKRSTELSESMNAGRSAPVNAPNPVNAEMPAGKAHVGRDTSAKAASHSPASKKRQADADPTPLPAKKRPSLSQLTRVSIHKASLTADDALPSVETDVSSVLQSRTSVASSQPGRPTKSPLKTSPRAVPSTAPVETPARTLYPRFFSLSSSPSPPPLSQLIDDAEKQSSQIVLD